ncbi:MAG: TonB-dependent receptor plug domain-containing protein, partial [Polyangiales bacterium]
MNTRRFERAPAVLVPRLFVLLALGITPRAAHAEEPEPEPETDAGISAEPDAFDDAMLEEELQLLDEQVYEGEEAAPPSEGEKEPSAPSAKPEPSAPMPELREVTVRYRPQDIFRMGGSVQALDQKQLESIQYDDPNAVLLQVPGVYIRQEDGFGLRPNIGLRGTNPNRSSKVTLMEDGVLFGPAPYSAPAAYYFPMMARITGVEVFKGPAAILYGPQSVAGAINYLSRPVPEKPRGQVDLSYGRFQTFRGHLHYGRKNDWGGFIVEGVYLS